MEMKNVFSVLPDNFFSALTGKYSQLVAECITLLYQKTKASHTFTLEKNFMVDLLDDHIQNSHTVVEDDEDKQLNSKDAASYIIKKLKDCGWIEEDLGKDYMTYYSISDYAIEIIKTLLNLTKDNEPEYSGYVYLIFHMLNNFQVENGYITLEQIYINTEELFRKLSNLNTSLKKYIQKLMTGKDKDSLHALLNQFLNDFQAKIVDRAYYNLMTKDHPEKYRHSILNKCYELREDDIVLQKLCNQMQDTKDITSEEAYERITTWIEYIVDSFESIGEILDSINSRLNQYIKSAVSRITYLLGVQEDLEGQLNRIMKAISKDEVDISSSVKIQNTSMINEDSLYVEKKIKKEITKQFVSDTEFDEAYFQDKLEALSKQSRYAKKAIATFVEQQLNNRYSMKASELIIEDSDLYSYPILIFLYGYSTNMNYDIEPLQSDVHKFSLHFKDFIIRRKS